MIEVVLRHDPALASPCTWRVSDSQDTIEARVRVAEGPETYATFAGRWRREAAQAPDAVFLAPVDAALEAWRTESARVHEALPRVVFLLTGTTTHAAEIMRAW